MENGQKKACGADIPGPGQYKLPELLGGCKQTDPTFAKSPCYSFGIRHKQVGIPLTPGPKYDISAVNKNGKITSPCAPLSARLGGVGSKYSSPSPGAYRPEEYMDATFTKAPAYSFGRLLPKKGYFVTPGPVYRPDMDSVKSRPPHYTMLGRHPEPKGTITPSPNQYGLPNLKMVKQSAPAYSLTSRRTGKGSFVTPGPGAYDPHAENVMSRPTSFKFNSLPNPCIKPYILPEDDEFNT